MDFPIACGYGNPTREGELATTSAAILKRFGFETAPVIGVIALCLGCVALAAQAQPVEVAAGVLQLGTIQSAAVSESSGLVASRRNPGFFWTHNDGDATALYAMTSQGLVTNAIKIKNTQFEDWEDIAAGGNRLYLADIGNNNHHREHVDIYAIAEPSLKRPPHDVEPVRHWKLHYPNDPFDAESLVVSHGFGYVIAKDRNPGQVYRFRVSGKTEATLEAQCTLDVSAPPAGADLTPDSGRLAVITSAGAYLFLLPRRVPKQGTIEPALFVPFSFQQMEGCCFTRDGLVVTSEGQQIFLFTDHAFQLRTGPRVLFQDH